MMTNLSYSVDKYYNTADFYLVLQAHQSLARQYHRQELKKTHWYWNIIGARELEPHYHREVVGPFTLHSGSLQSLPLPIAAIAIDSQIKTYMDRDALGDVVKLPATNSENGVRTKAREAELAKRVGGASFRSETQIVVVEYRGYSVGGMMVNPGSHNKTVAAIMESPSDRESSLAALQANYSLPPDDPFLMLKENEMVDLIKYFRLPDVALETILPPSLMERGIYRKTLHLIRALTISEVFALTDRWMQAKGRKITTVVCETPNEDVKLLFHGKKVKGPDGNEITMGGIPHRVLTAATGVELYPIPYAGRPDGKTKIFTLYAFDFAPIAAEAKVYRAKAMAVS